MNIRVDLNTPINDGMDLVFRSPVDCSQVTGLIVYYKENGNTYSKEFAFADAHGNNVGDIDHLFAENVVVKVILDVTTGMAFVQNADTNAYLEGRFNGLSDSIVCKSSGEIVSITDSAERPLQGLTLYGKTTQNGTPTPATPIALESAGDSGSLAVSVMGENLLGFQNLEPTVAQGGQMEIQDGVITRTATVTANVINIIPTELSAYIIPTELNPGTYLYSIDYLKKPPQWLASTKAYLKVILDDGTEAKIYEGVATELTQSGVISGVCVSILSMAVGDVLSFQPQLTCGTTAPTAYEPYKAPQTLTIPTPNGLPGIPVTSGGNYTDQKGQQWVCDEIDFTRGVYVQRIGNRTFTGDETDDWRPNTGGNETAVKHFYATALEGYVNLGYPNVLCTMLTYNSNAGSSNSTQINVCRLNPSYGYLLVDVDVTKFSTLEDFKAFLAEAPMIVSYILASPIETPLSAEELSVYAALHTNHPSTTVMTDGATTQVSYVADTKLYIDKKFAELASAIVNNT